MLEVSHLLKQYVTGSETLTVLRDISFKLAEGESFSIVGGFWQNNFTRFMRRIRSRNIGFRFYKRNLY